MTVTVLILAFCLITPIACVWWETMKSTCVRCDADISGYLFRIENGICVDCIEAVE